MPTKAKKSASKTSKRTKRDTQRVPAKPSVSKRSKAAARANKSAQLEQPKSPMPAQHQPKPGIESKLDPRPRFEAPLYKGAEKLKGKVALITGGDSGIGRAVAVLFAKEGADVAFTYLPEEQEDADETRAAIEDTGAEALALAGDLTDCDFCAHAVDETIESLGRLDILVNNAAFQQSQEKLEEISEEQWDHTFK